MIAADRELVENCTDEILPKREDEDVAFLVVGDPFGATTHTDLILRAKEKDIQVNRTVIFRIIIFRKYQDYFTFLYVSSKHNFQVSYF